MATIVSRVLDSKHRRMVSFTSGIQLEVTVVWRRLVFTMPVSISLRFMLMEVYDNTLTESMKYYDSGADMPFNFDFPMNMDATWGGNDIARSVSNWLSKMPEGKWPNWVVSKSLLLFRVLGA